MLIPLRNFTGEFPKTLPYQLPDNAAQYAVCCDFSSGNLVGMPDFGSSFSAPLGTKNLFAYGSDLKSTFAFTDEVSVVRGPIADDQYDRFYWTDGSYMRVSTVGALVKGSSDVNIPDPKKTYRVGVPAPSKPTVTASAKFEIDGADLSAWAIKAYCEDSSGNLSSPTSVVGGKLTINSTSAKEVKASAKVSISCNVKSTVLPSGFTDAGEFVANATESGLSLDYHGNKDQTFVKSEQFLGKRYRKAASSSKYPANFITYYYLFNYTAWEALGKPAIESGEYDPGFSTSTEGRTVVDTIKSGLVGEETYTPVYDSSAKLQYLGGGWFSQAWRGSSVTKPTFTPSGIDTGLVKGNDYSELVIVLTRNGKKIFLREDSNKTEFPSGISGLHGSADFSVAGKVSIYIWKDTSISFVTERAYVCTFVNQWGEESAPSLPASISVSEGMTVSIDIPSYHGEPSGSPAYAPIVGYRIYRTATGSNSTDYLLVTSSQSMLTSGVSKTPIKVSNVSASIRFEDALLDSALGEAISTLNYAPPPKGAKGLVAMPNGILSFFIGNEVYFCEPYLPYACDPSKTQTTLHDVVAMIPTDGGEYVITKSHPYLISGVQPGMMSSNKIQAIQAGVAERAVCDMGGTVVYASNDGLVAMRGLDASLTLSFQFFTREEWRKRYGARLNKMRLSAYDGHVVAWFSDGTPGFILRFDEAAPYFVRSNIPATGAYINPLTDSLYLVVGERKVQWSGGRAAVVHQFRGGSTKLPCEWISKDFVLPTPVNFGCFQVVGHGTAEVTIYADGIQIKRDGVPYKIPTISLNAGDRVVGRLPGGFKARKWKISFKLAAGSYIDEFYLAESPEELKNV